MRNEIIAFAKQYYLSQGEPPSVRTMVQKFRDNGLNGSSFYREFPKGVGELCRAAGIPVGGSLEQTRRATTSRQAAVLEARREIPRVSLTEGQTQRLFAISHLEGGRDPSSVLDEILDRDARLRKQYRLSMPKTADVSTFLTKAQERGWSIHGSPDILDCLTKAWNAGTLDLERSVLESAVDLVGEVKRHGLPIKDFVDYAVQNRELVILYSSYKCGVITAEEFRRRLPR